MFLGECLINTKMTPFAIGKIIHRVVKNPENSKSPFCRGLRRPLEREAAPGFFIPSRHFSSSSYCTIFKMNLGDTRKWEQGNEVWQHPSILYCVFWPSCCGAPWHHGKFGAITTMLLQLTCTGSFGKQAIKNAT